MQESKKVALKHGQGKVLLGNKGAGDRSLLLSAAKHPARLRKSKEVAGGGAVVPEPAVIWCYPVSRGWPF